MTRSRRISNLQERSRSCYKSLSYSESVVQLKGFIILSLIFVNYFNAAKPFVILSKLRTLKTTLIVNSIISLLRLTMLRDGICYIR